MKTLIINGSPRKNGDTVALLNELKANLRGEIVIINTYFDDIKPCTDCRYCWTHSKCIIEDRMTEVYSLLSEVDNVIIASPIYFSQLTGSLLSWASRLQYLYVSKIIRKDKDVLVNCKEGAIILTGGGDGDPTPAIKMATILIHQMGGVVVDSVYSFKTNAIPAKDDNESLLKIKKLALRLSK